MRLDRHRHPARSTVFSSPPSLTPDGSRIRSVNAAALYLALPCPSLGVVRVLPTPPVSAPSVTQAFDAISAWCAAYAALRTTIASGAGTSRCAHRCIQHIRTGPVKSAAYVELDPDVTPQAAFRHPLERERVWRCVGLSSESEVFQISRMPRTRPGVHPAHIITPSRSVSSAGAA